MSKKGAGKMGLWAVVAVGVGGMVGGGIFALLWLSYVVMLSLYAFAFGGYGATFLPQAWQGIGKHALISLAVVAIAGLNLLSAALIGKAEIWIVGIKLAILLLFVGAGVSGINASQIAPGSWSPPLQLAAGGMIIFLAYEGFELIANTAQDVRDVAKTLPRAYFIAVGFVIVLYVLVALVSVGNLPVDKIVAAKDYALAEAARPFLGQAGFLLIFAAVNGANARHAPRTHSRGWISAAGAAACLIALGALIWQTARTGPDMPRHHDRL